MDTILTKYQSQLFEHEPKSKQIRDMVFEYMLKSKFLSFKACQQIFDATYNNPKIHNKAKQKLVNQLTIGITQIDNVVTQDTTKNFKNMFDSFFDEINPFIFKLIIETVTDTKILDKIILEVVYPYLFSSKTENPNLDLQTRTTAILNDMLYHSKFLSSKVYQQLLELAKNQAYKINTSICKLVEKKLIDKLIYDMAYNGEDDLLKSIEQCIYKVDSLFENGSNEQKTTLRKIFDLVCEKIECTSSDGQYEVFNKIIKLNTAVKERFIQYIKDNYAKSIPALNNASKWQRYSSIDNLLQKNDAKDRTKARMIDIYLTTIDEPDSVQKYYMAAMAQHKLSEKVISCIGDEKINKRCISGLSELSNSTKELSKSTSVNDKQKEELYNELITLLEQEGNLMLKKITEHEEYKKYINKFIKYFKKIDERTKVHQAFIKELNDVNPYPPEVSEVPEVPGVPEATTKMLIQTIACTMFFLAKQSLQAKGSFGFTRQIERLERKLNPEPENTKKVNFRA